MSDCGYEWSGAIVTHRCTRKPGHAGLLHECLCGAEREYRHDDDEDETIRREGTP